MEVRVEFVLELCKEIRNIITILWKVYKQKLHKCKHNTQRFLNTEIKYIETKLTFWPQNSNESLLRRVVEEPLSLVHGFDFSQEQQWLPQTPQTEQQPDEYVWKVLNEHWLLV